MRPSKIARPDSNPMTNVFLSGILSAKGSHCTQQCNNVSGLKKWMSKPSQQPQKLGGEDEFSMAHPEV